MALILDEYEGSGNVSSENDQDETMEDMEDADEDQTGDMEADADNEDENDDMEQEDNQDSFKSSVSRSQRQPDSVGQEKPAVSSREGSAKQEARDGAEHDSRLRQQGNTDDFDSSSTHAPRSASGLVGHHAPFRPAMREEAVKALVYDIAPTIAAPHSTSINAVTATPDMRWVFSGGSDGWVRKFNWVDTANGKSMLTVAQRHPFVDSVIKAGVLTSYWENEDTSDRIATAQTAEEPLPLSPVYSLAVHHQALWLLSGTESGAINLHSVRHDEGKRITSLYHHTSAVSVMSLSQDETSLLSGSWDKTISDWDLNTGQVKRSFTGSGGQISAIEVRPHSNAPIARDIAPLASALNETMTTDSAAGMRKRGSLSSSTRETNRRPDQEDGSGSPGNDSLFGDNDSLFGDNDAGGASTAPFDQDEDDEFSRAIADGIQQQRQLEVNGDAMMDQQGERNEGDIGAAESPATALEPSEPQLNGEVTQSTKCLPHSEERPSTETGAADDTALPIGSENVFLDAAIDGTLRIWDRRRPSAIARIVPSRNVPPWCTHACWSPDGNSIYAGRRNGTVDEYSIHKSLREPHRTLKLPAGSGAVSGLRTMPNGKHLICASFDILRLYDLQEEDSSKRSRVPFLIVPGHRTGVVSQLYIDPTCSFMISTGGNRGWEGSSTEVLLGYEIGIGR